MKQVGLGTAGRSVSALGLGCVGMSDMVRLTAMKASQRSTVLSTQPFDAFFRAGRAQRRTGSQK
jgi:hypothetical protein